MRLHTAHYTGGFNVCISSGGTITRLESKVFSLERLYSLSRAEVTEAQTNFGSKIFFGPTRILWVRKNFVSETNF